MFAGNFAIPVGDCGMNGSGADEMMAGDVGSTRPATQQRVARGTSRSPRVLEFPHGAFALFGAFRLNEGAALKVGKLFCFNGRQSRVTTVFVRRPHLQLGGSCFIKTVPCQSVPRCPILSFQK